MGKCWGLQKISHRNVLSFSTVCKAWRAGLLGLADFLPVRSLAQHAMCASCNSVVLDKSTARVKVKGLSAPKPTSSVDAIGSEAAVPPDLAELLNAALQAATDDDSCRRPHSQQKRRRLRFSRPTGLSRRMRLPVHGSAAAAAAPRSAGQSRVWRGDRSSPGTAEQQLQTDFSRFVKLLVPTEAESSRKRSVLNALFSIRNELPQDIRRRCTIARIVIAGSVAKSTDLAGT